MPIKGTFTADFSSFSDAVQKAESSLKGFEASTNKVESSLNRMVDNFSGRKIITDATLMAEAVERVGGVAHLTEAELARVGKTAQEAADKMRAWGQDVPPRIQAIADAAANLSAQTGQTTGFLSGLQNQIAAAFSIGAVIQFGREVLAAGDHIQKMADQTGLSYDKIQRLDYIAGQTGSSIESLVGAAQNLQLRLGDDNSGAAAAVKKLGINLEDFNKLDTYDQMVAISEGLASVKDPTEKATDAAALFGKTWKEILPALKSDMRALGDEAPKMADDTVKALDRAGDALTRAKQQAIVWGAGTVNAIEQVGYAFGNFFSMFDTDHFGLMNSEVLEMEGLLNDPNGLKGALAALPPPMANVGAAAKDLTFSLEKEKEMIAELNKHAQESIEENKQWAITKAAVNKLEREGQDIKAGLLGMNADEQKATQKTMETYVTSYDTIDKARKALNNELAKNALEARDFQILRIWEEADAAVAASKLKGADLAEYTRLVNALATEQAQAVRDAADKAAAATEAAAARQVAANTVVSKSWYAVVDAALAAAAASNGLDVSVGSRPGDPGTGPNEGSMERGAPINAPVGPPINGGSVNYNPTPLFKNTAARAAGGPVESGTPYLVGEKGPELYTPAADGFITPNGAGGVVVHNTFNIVDTESNIARRVSASITRSIMAAHKL